MSSFLCQDKEFEKNKKEILRRIVATNPNLEAININSDAGDRHISNNDNRKYAWEYEIEEYRKKKNRDRFYKIGALAGVLSLIITVIDKFTPIKEITHIAFNYIFK